MTKRLFQAGSLFGGTVAAFTSAAASICCIGPLAIALLGVNGAILAAAFKPYRVYLLSGSLVLLAGAFWTRIAGPPPQRATARRAPRRPVAGPEWFSGWRWGYGSEQSSFNTSQTGCG